MEDQVNPVQWFNHVSRLDFSGCSMLDPKSFCFSVRCWALDQECHHEWDMKVFLSGLVGESPRQSPYLWTWNKFKKNHVSEWEVVSLLTFEGFIENTRNIGSRIRLTSPFSNVRSDQALWMDSFDAALRYSMTRKILNLLISNHNEKRRAEIVRRKETGEVCIDDLEKLMHERSLVEWRHPHEIILYGPGFQFGEDFTATYHFEDDIIIGSGSSADESMSDLGDELIKLGNHLRRVGRDLKKKGMLSGYPIRIEEDTEKE